MEATCKGDEAIARPRTVLRLPIQEVGMAGNLTSDAHLAAQPVEHTCTLCSADSDLRRFPGLRFLKPLA
ncbi:MAG: hypothetical protein WBN89_10745 [Prochlorococcaceae cyanobacterium]